MQVIPVLDIQQGHVVHAIGGQRNRYRPVQSQICAGSDPGTILRAFLDIHPFTVVYIADLDAILSGQPDNSSMHTLLDSFPDLHFWLDQGLLTKTDFINASHNRICQIAGSETGLAPEQLSALIKISPQPILSLDFRAGAFLGNISLLHHPEIWPDKVILMNLDHVGTASGGDMHLVKQITRTALHSHVYIAGGIRDITDLLYLKDLGVAGILTATALHARRLSPADIKAVTGTSQKKMPRKPGHYHSNG